MNLLCDGHKTPNVPGVEGMACLSHAALLRLWRKKQDRLTPLRTQKLLEVQERWKRMQKPRQSVPCRCEGKPDTLSCNRTSFLPMRSFASRPGACTTSCSC